MRRLEEIKEVFADGETNWHPADVKYLIDRVEKLEKVREAANKVQTEWRWSFASGCACPECSLALALKEAEE